MSRPASPDSDDTAEVEGGRETEAPVEVRLIPEHLRGWCIKLDRSFYCPFCFKRYKMMGQIHKHIEVQSTVNKHKRTEPCLAREEALVKAGEAVKSKMLETAVHGIRELIEALPPKYYLAVADEGVQHSKNKWLITKKEMADLRGSMMGLLTANGAVPDLAGFDSAVGEYVYYPKS